MRGISSSWRQFAGRLVDSFFYPPRAEPDRDLDTLHVTVKSKQKLNAPVLAQSAALPVSKAWVTLPFAGEQGEATASACVALFSAAQKSEELRGSGRQIKRRQQDKRRARVQPVNRAKAQPKHPAPAQEARAAQARLDAALGSSLAISPANSGSKEGSKGGGKGSVKGSVKPDDSPSTQRIEKQSAAQQQSAAKPVATDAPAAQPSTAKASPARKPRRSALRAVPVRPKLEHRILQVDGCQIHAVERAPLPGHRARGAKAERDSERAVILIHGAGVDHRDWTFGFMNELTPAWRVLAFDRPGFGHSERTALDGALPMSQARILRRAALDLGVTEAVVVGHSWGGAVAAAWALEGKDQVLGAVSLAGAVMPWSLASSIEHGRRIRHATQLAMSPGGMEQAAMEGMAESFAPQVIPKGYADHMRTHLSMYSGAAMATAADVATVNGALGIQSQRYYALDCPFELVYGDEDRILSVAEQGGAAQSRISQTRLTVLKGAGHMIHHTHTKACHTAIARLCEQADRQAMVPGARSRSAARGAVA